LILIDVDKNGALSTQWGVRGIPSMHFADVTGKEIEKYAGGRDALSFAKKFSEIASKHTVSTKPAVKVSLSWQTDFAKARESSKKSGKALFALFSADVAAASKKIEEMGGAFSGMSTQAFVYVRLKIDKDAEPAKSLSIAGDTIVMFDPDEPEPEKAVLTRKDEIPSLDDLKSLLVAYKKPGYRCDKCKKTGFVERTCCDNPMKAVDRK
jgi:hypothetical protein